MLDLHFVTLDIIGQKGFKRANQTSFYEVKVNLIGKQDIGHTQWITHFMVILLVGNSLTAELLHFQKGRYQNKRGTRILRKNIKWYGQFPV